MSQHKMTETAGNSLDTQNTSEAVLILDSYGTKND